MRDYEAVAKQAKVCASRKYCDIGGNCEYYDLDVCCQGGEKDILKDAADAIEELLARDVVPMDFHERCLQLEIKKRIELEKQMPQWISVEDDLPEEWRAVLAYMPILSDEKNPHMILICWYIGNGKWRETEYGEIVEIPVTHWMPLPDPPKGVE